MKFHQNPTNYLGKKKGEKNSLLLQTDFIALRNNNLDGTILELSFLDAHNQLDAVLLRRID